MRTLGIDPGLEGGIAVVVKRDDLSGIYQLLEVIDIPIVGYEAGKRVDVQAVVDFICKWQPARAYIEHAQAMPKQGVSSVFKYGRSVGALEACVVMCSIPIVFVHPSVWKRKWALIGKDKEASRQLALQEFPTAHKMLARKKDHGRAEAALIACG